jgi:hypothetical protein
MEHAKHIIRAVLLLVFVTVVFVIVRHFAVPSTFGAYGHFRYGSVADITARRPVHGGRVSCAECHADEMEFIAENRHASINCEVCHAPVATHAVAGEVVAEMPVRRTIEVCAWCHQRLEARPKTFPQIVLVDHVVDKGGQMSEGICLECHDAHEPFEE